MGVAIDKTLVKTLGPGSYRTRVNNTDIYLNAGVYARLVQQPAALAQVLQVVRDAPGVRRAYTGEAIGAAASSVEPLVRAAALSYYPGRSGDLILLQKPYWTPSLDTTSHGSGHRYDTRVPVVLYGAGRRTVRVAGTPVRGPSNDCGGECRWKRGASARADDNLSLNTPRGLRRRLVV